MKLRQRFSRRRLPLFYRMTYAITVVCLSWLGISAQPFPEQLFSNLEWRSIGPFRGGRVVAVAGVPSQPDTFYFGAVGGGIWKSTDAGNVWRPIFDQQHVASIGALAVASSNPDVLYAGTGEADIRSDLSSGDGVYKSTDAGAHWTHSGLQDSRQIARIAVDPTDPNRVFVAVLGHAYGPNPERGVFRSTDGGATWERVLYKSPDVGAVDLAIVPENPRIIYAVLWNAHRPPWSTYAAINGPGSGLYRSTDGGSTWTQLTGHGLPEGDWGRAGIDVAAHTNGRRIYALIEAKTGGLYRSDDGGENWTLANGEARLTARAWYFSGVTADPQNPDAVYLPNVATYHSTDAGKTITILRGAPGGDDYHSLWINPAAPARMILGTDQGATVSLNRGQTWSTWLNQPTAQIYHVITDNAFPYRVYGAQQDSGTAVLPSTTDHGPISERDFENVGGAESGYIAPDPRNPDIFYVNNTYGSLARFDRRTSQSQVVSPSPEGAFGTEINNRRYRNTWTSPLVFSPKDPAALYFGTQFLLKTTDGGSSWQRISPDLTGDTRPPGTLDPPGPVTIANARERGFGVIYTIAPSPLEAGTIWTGSDTGLIYLTRDGGKTWNNVTPPDLAAWSKVTLIEASHTNPAVAYAAIDRHRLDDDQPYLYRTRDGGKTWTSIINGLAPHEFLNAVREDPFKPGLLYACTERGLAVSFDDGAHWQPFSRNLPAVSVRDLTIHGNDLVIATHGRGFWIMDDVSSLRQLDPHSASSDLTLFKPAAAVRLFQEGFPGTPLPLDTPTAKNPARGAVFDYYLNQYSASPVTLEVLDGNQVIWSSSSNAPPWRRPDAPIADVWFTPPPRVSAQAGMHRFIWNLQTPEKGPYVLPGRYTARLTANERTVTQPLVIVPDPRSDATDADRRAQFELASKASAKARAAEELLSRVHAASKELTAGMASPRITPELTAEIRATDKLLNLMLTTNPRPLPAVISGLEAVLAALASADRRPTRQDAALFEECSAALDQLTQQFPQPTLNRIRTQLGGGR